MLNPTESKLRHQSLFKASRLGWEPKSQLYEAGWGSVSSESSIQRTSFQQDPS